MWCIAKKVWGFPNYDLVGSHPYFHGRSHEGESRRFIVPDRRLEGVAAIKVRNKLIFPALFKSSELSLQLVKWSTVSENITRVGLKEREFPNRPSSKHSLTNNTFNFLTNFCAKQGETSIRGIISGISFVGGRKPTTYCTPTRKWQCGGFKEGAG